MNLIELVDKRPITTSVYFAGIIGILVGFDGIDGKIDFPNPLSNYTFGGASPIREVAETLWKISFSLATVASISIAIPPQRV